MRNCILLSFDDNFFQYAKPCLNSFQKNFPDHPLIQVLYLGNNPKIISFLEKLENVERLELEFDLEQFSGLNLGVGSSLSMYARFILWTDVFDDFDHVMYLDSDTIVLQPFPEIFDSEDFFCVLDSNGEGMFLEKHNDNSDLHDLLRRDGLDKVSIDTLMINSGMFVLPKKYRTKKQLGLLWTLANRYHLYSKYGDQSIISIWCLVNNIKGSTDYKYNFQVHYVLTELFTAIRKDSIKILHFAFWKPNGKLDHILLPAIKYIMDLSKSYEELAARD